MKARLTDLKKNPFENLNHLGGFRPRQEHTKNTLHKGWPCVAGKQKQMHTWVQTPNIWLHNTSLSQTFGIWFFIGRSIPDFQLLKFDSCLSSNYLNLISVKIRQFLMDL
jgi:hypothetical protein